MIPARARTNVVGRAMRFCRLGLHSHRPYKRIAFEAGSATIPGRMSKICSLCGKKPGFGNNRSHSMVATKRRFNPNLQRVRMMLNGKAMRAYVCTRCLKAGKVTKAV